MRVLSEWVFGLGKAVLAVIGVITGLLTIATVVAWALGKGYAIPWILVVGLTCLLVASFLNFRRVVLQRAALETKAAAATAAPVRKGVINRPGGTAYIYRPTYGEGLGVGVDNQGELHHHDPEHE